MEHEGVSLARRMSGGGAVYHDMGNLNFTFSTCLNDSDPDRQRAVIVRACALLGAKASVSGRNDILVGGKKVSGHSFYRHDGKAFHNGTLLVCSNLDRLSSLLTPPAWKWQGASVPSVRSRVANLNETVPGLTADDM